MDPDTYISGVFSSSQIINTDGCINGSDKILYDIRFSASLSNPIYGKGTTVQPPALTIQYIMKY